MSVFIPATCVTKTVFDATPFAETVTVAVRVVVLGLAIAVNKSVAVSWVAVLGLIVNHDSFEIAFQVVFDKTVIVVVLLESLSKLAVFVETNKLVSPAACIIFIV